MKKTIKLTLDYTNKFDLPDTEANRKLVGDIHYFIESQYKSHRQRVESLERQVNAAKHEAAYLRDMIKGWAVSNYPYDRPSNHFSELN